jgi:hypothetical protein
VTDCAEDLVIELEMRVVQALLSVSLILVIVKSQLEEIVWFSSSFDPFVQCVICEKRKAKRNYKKHLY